MDMMRLGLDLRGQPLFEPIPEATLAASLVASLAPNAPGVRRVSDTTARSAVFRGEVRRTVVDPGDPRSVGWTCLLNARDPRKADILAALEPLARHRGLTQPWTPLLFDGSAPEAWLGWLNDNYHSTVLTTRKRPPQYILIVGDAEQVPFRFQSLLASVANVGRLTFDTLAELEQYVAKLVRLESAAEPVTERSVTFFAPDGGIKDPTHYSCEMMVKPLAQHVSSVGMKAKACLGSQATKRDFLEATRGSKPALVYTASHGLGAIGESADRQRALNGAICCQARELTLDALFTAEDVPMDEPYLEGSIFFQFACFGYGTPAQSDYEHWIGDGTKNLTDQDFVAALPKRLLAHPRGPIAYIGHVDTAFLHGFADPAALSPLDRWGNRMAPFKSALDRLIEANPSGLAMEDMGTRYASANAVITNVYDQIQRGGFEWTEERSKRFLDQWIVRSDAQNYFVLGDPGARVRIPSQ